MARYMQSQQQEIKSGTRQRLIEAATQEFALKGYDSANINTISLAAGFAKGTIYNYFSGKQALLLEIIQEAGAAHLEHIASQVRRETQARLRLLRFFDSGFRFVEEHPARARLLINTVYSVHAEFRESIFKVYLPMFQLVSKEILAYGIQRGVFRQIDPVKSASLIMTIYLGTCSGVDENGRVYLDSKEVADFVWRSICNPLSISQDETT